MKSITLNPVDLHDLYNEVRKAIEEGHTPQSITLTEYGETIAFSLN